MKTRIVTPEWGSLACVTGSKEITYVPFKVKTLVNWYPLNINYEYKFFKKDTKLYLIPIEEGDKLGYPDYDLDYKKGRSLEEDRAIYLDKGEFEVKEVKNDNLKLIKRAKENFKLKTTLLDTGYSVKDVDRELERINTVHEELRDKLRDRLLDHIDIHDLPSQKLDDLINHINDIELNDYEELDSEEKEKLHLLKQEWEKRDMLIYEFLTDQDIQTLRDIGKVRSMLTIMRKIAIVNDKEKQD